MAWPIVRRGAVLGLGVLWWWAVLRLVFEPGAGVIEGAVAAGGWGLSLLPVHCVPKARAEGAVGAGRWRAAWRTARATTASPPRRWDAGSGRW
ncbi:MULTISPECIES: hypothetical protein [unclassified Streptomyces]|uniref:hypothetical protein n=1 Tax=unclassified Streptomyces TaxID=2593676 RepID=UPI0032544BFC